MKQQLILTATILLLIFSCSSSQQPKELSDVDQIKASFAVYKSSLLEIDGQKAVENIDKNTRDYYQKILNYAKTGDSISIQSLNVMDKLMTLTIRHRIADEQILEMDGSDLLVYLIDNKMMGQGKLESTTLDSIRIDGKFARAELLFSGQKSSVFTNFNKEEDGWKVDLTSIFQTSNASLMQMIGDNHITEEKFIIETLTRTTGIAPTSNIWKPIVQ